jgi:hypothetical protein
LVFEERTGFLNIVELPLQGGLVVSVVTIGPKVCWFKHGRGLWIFKGDKNPPHTFVGEIKPSATCKIFRHVKQPYECERDTSQAKFNGHFLAMFLLLR